MATTSFGVQHIGRNKQSKMASNASMSKGKFYYGSSSASPWINDLMHKKNIKRELKGVKLKLKKGHHDHQPLHMKSGVKVKFAVDLPPAQRVLPLVAANFFAVCLSVMS